MIQDIAADHLGMSLLALLRCMTRIGCETIRFITALDFSLLKNGITSAIAVYFLPGRF